MGSCSSLSTIGSPDYNPYSINLITMKLSMRLLLVLSHRYFLEFSKEWVWKMSFCPGDIFCHSIEIHALMLAGLGGDISMRRHYDS